MSQKNRTYGLFQSIFINYDDTIKKNDRLERRNPRLLIVTSQSFDTQYTRESFKLFAITYYLNEQILQEIHFLLSNSNSSS